MKRILVICTHNSARSQMAEGWLRQLSAQAGLEAEIWSAGTEKTRVKPEAVQVMAEVGVDLESHWSKTLQELPAGEFDVVLTVCEEAAAACPFFPGAHRCHLGLPDPSGQGLERWRQSRDQVGRVMQRLVARLSAGEWPEGLELNDD